MEKALFNLSNWGNNTAKWLEKKIVLETLNNPFGYLLMVLVAIFTTLVIIKLGAFLGSIFLIATLGTSFVFIFLLKPKFSIFFSIAFSFFLAQLTRYLLIYHGQDIELGIILDSILLIGLLGIFIDQSRRKEKGLSFILNPITYIYFVYIVFLGIQLLNPNLQETVTWVLYARRLANLLCIYFIVLYTFRDLKFLKLFLVLWISLAFIAGLYGCFQQWFGFFLPVDQKFIIRAIILVGKNPFMHDGVLRQFSFFSDPTAFGMFMASSGILCVSILMGPFGKIKKFFILIVTVIIFLGMAYSGTRTAYVMVLAGLMLVFLMTINNKNTLIVSTIIGAGVVFLFFGPIEDNKVINRIRTAIEGSDDASMNIRNIKRQLTQPLLLEYPIGGGVYTSGVIGRKHDPNHYLSKYIVDSGYMKTALETGIIGLILVMLCYTIAISVGIKSLYKLKDPKLRYIMAGMIGGVFSLYIATYAQKSIDQVPTGLILYCIFAIFVKIPEIEKLKHDKKE